MAVFYVVVNDREVIFEAPDLREAKILAADCGGNPEYVFERKEEMTEEVKQEIERHMAAIAAIFYDNDVTEFQGETIVVNDGGKELAGAWFKIGLYEIAEDEETQK